LSVDDPDFIFSPFYPLSQGIYMFSNMFSNILSATAKISCRRRRRRRDALSPSTIRSISSTTSLKTSSASNDTFFSRFFPSECHELPLDHHALSTTFKIKSLFSFQSRILCVT